VKPVEKDGGGGSGDGGGHMLSEVSGRGYILSSMAAKTKQRRQQKDPDGQAYPRLSVVARASAAGGVRRWRRRSRWGEGADDGDGRRGIAVETTGATAALVGAASGERRGGHAARGTVSDAAAKKVHEAEVLLTVREVWKHEVEAIFCGPLIGNLMGREKG
jgi:hypothetical protein